MSAQNRRPVHYELFVRKNRLSGWALQLASENREAIILEAQELLSSKAVVAVKVTKESLDPTTGEYTSIALLTQGYVETKRNTGRELITSYICTAPQDLYTPIAREKIGRLLEDWLKRNGVTAFEMMHRPDLVEKLEANGTELQHVIQKLSIAMAQENGSDLHDLMRRWRDLIDRSITRLIQDGRKKRFLDLNTQGLTQIIEQLEGDPDRSYRLGGSIAHYLSKDRKPLVKLEKILRLIIDPKQLFSYPLWVRSTIEAVVIEQFSLKHVFSDHLGQDSDLANIIALQTRLLVHDDIEKIRASQPEVSVMLPSLKGTIEDYRVLIRADYFGQLRPIILRTLIEELKGPKRLRPLNATEEVKFFHAICMVLNAYGADENEQNTLKDALNERSKMLVSAEFIEALIAQAKNASEEVDLLLMLTENVTGSTNQRQAARWLISALGSVKFERDMRDPNTSTSGRLQKLANWQWRTLTINLHEKDVEDIAFKLGALGGLIAQDVKLLSHLLRASPDPLKALTLMLGFATGKTGPFGPLSDQAKIESMKILRNPDVRRLLAEQPQMLEVIKPLLIQAKLAA